MSEGEDLSDWLEDGYIGCDPEPMRRKHSHIIGYRHKKINISSRAPNLKSSGIRLCEHKRKSLYTHNHKGGERALTQEEIEKRKGNPTWCQVCLKRRVHKGYKTCFFCS